MPSTRLIALIRGINVGRAKRVAMADLRAMLEKMGYRDVRTLLNSGNVVFTAPRAVAGDHALRISRGIEKQLGVAARVTVISGTDLATAIAENPFVKLARDPSRYLIYVPMDPDGIAKLKPVASTRWHPEAIGLGKRVAYLWCANGILESPLAKAIDRVLGDGGTARNWTTMGKLHGLATETEAAK